MCSHSQLLSNIFEFSVTEPLKAAVIINDEAISYEQLRKGVLQYIHTFRTLGLRTGDRVVFSACKDKGFLFSYIAAHALGIVKVIIDPLLNTDRIEFIERETEAKFGFGYVSPNISCLSYNALAEKIETGQHSYFIEKIGDNFIAEIIFTTGTTEEPKGVCLSYKNIDTSVNNINKYIGNRNTDIEIIGLPLCHSFGLGRLRCNLALGATAVIINNFSNVRLFFNNIEKYHVTGFAMVPAVWEYIKKISGTRISKFKQQIKYIEIGSSHLDIESKKELLTLLPETKIVMHYGLTEASRSCFINFSDINHLDSIGQPVNDSVALKILHPDGSECALGETGEICLNGPHVGQYLRVCHNTSSFQGDFLKTGDLGYKDHDGFIHLVGRNKEMINIGGKKVSPIEIEEAIISLGVEDCVCIGIKDPRGILGEVVKCFIKKTPDSIPFERITELLTDKLENFKIPAEYCWIDEIPKSQSGKKLRNRLNINSAK